MRTTSFDRVGTIKWSRDDSMNIIPVLSSVSLKIGLEERDVSILTVPQPNAP